MDLIARATKKELQQREGYDPARLRRAIKLGVKRMGPHQYRVQGTEEPFYDVNLELDTPCTCADSWHHGRGCKHEIAARMQDGDPAIILALGEELLRASKLLDEALERKKRTLKLMPETK